MFLVGLLQWWYGHGWIDETQRMGRRLQSTAAFFSIGQLASTLFAPFRQISAGRVSGSLSVQARAFFDTMLSRFIGAFVRLATILAGMIVLVIQGVVAVIVLIGWWIIPLLPVVGLLLFAIGWVPQWN